LSEENELPNGWAWTRVGEIYNIVGGGTPSTDIEEYWKGDIAWITSADIYGLKDIRPRKRITKAAIENSATNLVPAESLIVVTRIGLGKVALTKIPLCFSQDSQSLIGVSSSIHPDYSLYYLAQATQVFKYQSRGTTIAGVTKNQLSELPFPLPPFAEQQRIVAAIEQQFSRLDVGVAALRQAKEKLKRYRAAVLKAAVEGKLTETWRAEHPATEPASKLLERILSERRAKWEADLRAKGKDSAKVRYVEPKGPDVESLPELPEGWRWATVEQVTSRSEYGTSIKCDYTAKGIPVLRIPNIAAGEIDLSDMKYSVQPLAIDQDSALQSGDILVCRTNGSVSLIGKAALVRVPLEPYHTFASYLLRFRLFEASILPRWLHLFVSSSQGRAFIESNAASSAGQHNISLTLMYSMRFPVPPLAEQEQIASEVEQRLSIVSELEATVEANLKRAERLRQSILKEAFAGRLVPQDPNDEPASVLLERIRGERNGRKNGKVDRKAIENIVLEEPVNLDVEGMQQAGLWEGVGG